MNKWARRFVVVAVFAIMLAAVFRVEPSRGMEIVAICMALTWYILFEGADLIADGYAILYMRALKRAEEDPRTSTIAKDINEHHN